MSQIDQRSQIDHQRSQIDHKEWITTTEATRFLNISSRTMARLIREGRIKTYQHPLDRRKKLVRRNDIVNLKQEADRMAA